METPKYYPQIPKIAQTYTIRDKVEINIYTYFIIY